MAKKALTLSSLIKEAKAFAEMQSTLQDPSLFGVTDGKAVGTYVEHRFQAYIAKSYSFGMPNSAVGIDFPSLNVDVKVTRIVQPQSSSPFKSARQKIFGLGHHLIIFVYEKTDHAAQKTARDEKSRNFRIWRFPDACRTGRGGVCFSARTWS